MSKNDVMEQLLKKLEDGLKNFINDDRYRDYLNAMSKFHNYSARNILLILHQNPNATRIASYDTWKKLGRQVQVGSKGLNIFVPIIKNHEVIRPKINPITKKPIFGEDGKEITEKITNKYLTFSKRSVFDISQTKGKELPKLANELSGDIENNDLFLKSLFSISKAPIVFEEINSSYTKGYYDRLKNKIVIKKGMSQKQTIKTLVHEMAHSEIHNLNNDEKTRATKEVEAESIAYLVCQNYSIDTSDYSFGYITSWRKSKDSTTINNSLEQIKTTSSDLIKRLDEKQNELMLLRKKKLKNREMEIER